MSKTIAESLTALDTHNKNIDSAVTSIKTSLTNKGVTPPATLKLSAVPTYINNIYNGNKATITVTASGYNGQSLTCSLGSTSYTQTVSSNKATFTVTTAGIWTIKATDGNQTTVEIKFNESTTLEKKIYGFYVSNTESDPYKRVVYTDDAVGMTPAEMKLSFSWGDWQDVFFNKLNHVYRIKSDGTIVGQCMDYDYSKFIDGSDSGITGSGHTDNFMASIPTCWVYRYTSGNYTYVKIANYQVNSNYKAYAHTDANGKVQDFIYWGVYRGCNVNSRLRSISKQPMLRSVTITTEFNYATANGSRWHLMDWADIQLRNDLLTLMFKTTNLQRYLGRGIVGGEALDNYRTGDLDTSGPFHGNTTLTGNVKCFHCEDQWGLAYMRVAGVMTNSSSNLLVKMTRPYNTTGSGYTTLSNNSKTARGYWSTRTTAEYGTYPTASAGSDSTYEADYYMVGASGYPQFGGSAGDANMCGPFFMGLSAALGHTYDGSGGAVLSFK